MLQKLKYSRQILLKYLPVSLFLILLTKVPSKGQGVESALRGKLIDTSIALEEQRIENEKQRIALNSFEEANNRLREAHKDAVSARIMSENDSKQREGQLQKDLYEARLGRNIERVVFLTTIVLLLVVRR